MEVKIEKVALHKRRSPLLDQVIRAEKQIGADVCGPGKTYNRASPF